ncbi:L,D-transpeptidase family protein [Nocardia mexicana]|uniref:L,D-peptidoglycan transpeptidase YkuD (ErfK/YbiS/YcfS/YnhG family) n=1 Tax=Nocardia mexicana TaxID=279262 RepID=A0A370HB42_9NOCA|nr:L,D-transpeptidase family protein [Nocardia mexicana]RDI54146.1 L,D-peptidoglycan transpeptidase YkuD (ErfK/YbiS/YcfS/YnhG family) [Nocardia mexicana]
MSNSDFRNKASWLIATVVVVILAVTGIFLLLPGLTADEPPFDADAVPGTQVVWVTAKRGADHGTLELWQRGSRWKRTLSTPAWVGKEGISKQAREGSSFTPEGTFAVSEAFGRMSDTRARLPYLPVDPSNTWWWVSDTASPLYNQKYQCADSECPFDTEAAENLGETDPQYNYALVIDYNRTPVVAGQGSAFFVHVAVDKPTAGCVSVSEDVMRTLLATLEPSRKPVIGMYAT